MNDFDFEELDKAVNNLATKTHEEGGPAPTTAPGSRVTITPAAPSSPAVEARPEPVATTPVAPMPSSDEPPAVKSTSTPAKHRLGDTRARRGAFMDIVPPSPRKTPTRVGVSVQPVSKAEEVVPDAPAAAPAKPEPKEPELPDLSDLKLDLDMAPKAPEPKPEPAESQAPPTTEQTEGDKKPDEDVAWPDPLDFNDAPAKAAKSAEPTPVEPTEPVSPFLAEAKVEKRPLGAFSNFKPVEEPKPAETPEPVESKPQKPQGEPTPEKAPLPPKEGEKMEEKEPAKPDVHGAAMMAIPDQYRPEPKTTDKTTRPVYDTKEYHPPLVEAAGHHEHRGGGSVWGKIFIALVALALIAVAGYFAYVYFIAK